MQHGLAHGFGGNGAGVDAGTTDDALLYHRDTLAQLRAVDRSPLAAGPEPSTISSYALSSRVDCSRLFL
jgi:hypothetical protein